MITINITSLYLLEIIIVICENAIYCAGHGGEHSLSVPYKMRIKNFKIMDISASKYHTLIASRSMVMACGLNMYLALGIPNAGLEILDFTTVIDLSNPKYSDDPIYGVVACDRYSLAYCDKGSLYFWGTNSGQFPNKGKDDVVEEPYLVSVSYTNIKLKSKLLTCYS